MYGREGKKRRREEGRARVRGCEGALRLWGVVVVVVRAANGRGVNKGVREGCGSKMNTVRIFTMQAMAKGDLRWSAVVVATKRCGPVAKKVWRQRKGSFLCSPKGKTGGEECRCVLPAFAGWRERGLVVDVALLRVDCVMPFRQLSQPMNDWVVFLILWLERCGW